MRTTRLEPACSSSHYRNCYTRMVHYLYNFGYFNSEWGTSAKKKKRSCLKTNRAVTSLAFPGVIFRLWPDQPPVVVLLIATVWGEKKQKQKTNKKKYVRHSHGQKVPIALLMNCINAAMFLGSADPTMDEVLHRARQGSSRLTLFWGNFFFFFLFGVSPSLKMGYCGFRLSYFQYLRNVHLFSSCFF